VSLDEERLLNFGNRLHLDQIQKFFEGFFNIADTAFFHNLGSLLSKTDGI